MRSVASFFFFKSHNLLIGLTSRMSRLLKKLHYACSYYVRAKEGSHDNVSVLEVIVISHIITEDGTLLVQMAVVHKKKQIKSFMKCENNITK